MPRGRFCLRPDRIGHPKRSDRILLTPVQELDMVRMDFGRLHYYRQPDITRAQFAYLAIYLVRIGNVAAGEARTERLFPWIGRRAL